MKTLSINNSQRSLNNTTNHNKDNNNNLSQSLSASSLSAAASPLLTLEQNPNNETNLIKDSKSPRSIKLNSHDESFLKLKQKAKKNIKEGGIVDALDDYESTLSISLKLYGIQSDDHINHVTQTIEELNKIAMKYMHNKDIETCTMILNKCDEWLKSGNYGHFPTLRCLTINNSACVYRRLNMLDRSHKLLNNALSILKKANMMDNASITFLNLCAVLSQIGDHTQALQHARNAVIYGQQEVLAYKNNQDCNENKFKEKVTLLAIAYHNMGVEEDFLKNIDQSIKWYTKSCKILTENGINDDKLYQKFENALITAKDKLILNNLRNKQNTASMNNTNNGDNNITNNNNNTNTIIDKSLIKKFNSTSRLPSAETSNIKEKELMMTIKAPYLSNANINNNNNNNNKQQFYMRNGRLINRNTTASNLNIKLPSKYLSRQNSINQKIILPNSSGSIRANSKPYGENNMGIIDLSKIKKRNSEKRSPITTNPVYFNHFIPENVSTPTQRDLNTDSKTNLLEVSDRAKANLDEFSLNETATITYEDNEIKRLEKEGLLIWSDGNDHEKDTIEDKNLKVKRLQFLSSLQSFNQERDAKSLSLHDESVSSIKLINDNLNIKAQKSNSRASFFDTKKSIDSKNLAIQDNLEIKSTQNSRRKLVDFHNITKKASITNHINNPTKPSNDKDKDNDKDDNDDIGDILLVGIDNLDLLSSSPHLIKKESNFSTPSKARDKPLTKSPITRSPTMKSKPEEKPEILPITETEPIIESDHEQKLPQRPLPPISEQIEAAIRIQAYYRMHIQRYHYLIIIRCHRDTRQVLLRNMFLKLPVFQSMNNQQYEITNKLYNISIYLIESENKIYIIAKDILENKKYDASIIIDSEKIPIIPYEKILTYVNKTILRNHAENLLKTAYIHDFYLKFNIETLYSQLSYQRYKSKESDIRDDLDLTDEHEKYNDLNYNEEGEVTKEEKEEEEEDIMKKIERLKDFNNKKYQAAIKIQRAYRSYITRQRFALLRNQKSKLVFTKAYKAITLYYQLSIYRDLKLNNFFAKAYIYDLRISTNQYLIPPKLKRRIRYWSDAVNYIELNEKILEITKQENVEDDEEDNLEGLKKAANLLPKYDEAKIIKLQAHWKGHLTRQTYNLKLAKKRENPTCDILNQKIIIKEDYYFYVSVHYESKDDLFVVKAAASTYHTYMQPLYVPYKKLDHDPHGNHKSKTRRLADILLNNVSLKRDEADNTIVLIVDNKTLEKYISSTKKAFNAKETLVLETTKAEYEQRANARNNFRNHFFNQGEKKILHLEAKANKLDEQTTREIESISQIVDFKKRETEMIIKIQSCYRGFRIREAAKLRKKTMELKKTDDKKTPQSAKRGHFFSKKPKHNKNKEEKNYAPDSTLIHTQNIEFKDFKDPNKVKSILLNVYWTNKTKKESNDTDIDDYHLELKLSTTSDKDFQTLYIDPDEIMQDFDLEKFKKDIKTYLIDKLNYDIFKRKVTFKSEFQNIDGHKKNQKTLAKMKEEAAVILVQSHYRKMLVKQKAGFIKSEMSKDSRFLTKLLKKYDNVYVDVSFFYVKSEQKIKIVGREVDDKNNKDAMMIDLTELLTPAQYSDMRKYMEKKKVSENVLKDIFNEVIKKMKKHVFIKIDKNNKAINVIFDLESCRCEISSDENIMRFTIFDSDYEASDDDKKTIRKILPKKTAKIEEPKPENLANVNEIPKIEKKIEEKSQTLAKKRVIDTPKDALFAIIWCQKQFRAKRLRELFMLRKKKNIQMQEHHKYLGKLIDQTIKQISGEYYTICIYQPLMQYQGQERMYNFTAVPYKNKSNQDNMARGTYIINQAKLINTGGKTLTDYLINKLAIKDKVIMFNVSLDHFVPLNEKATDQLKISKKENQDQILDKNDDTPNVNFKRSMTKRKTKKMDANLIQDEDIQDTNILLQQKTNSLIPNNNSNSNSNEKNGDNDNICIYNIYYNSNLDKFVDVDNNNSEKDRIESMGNIANIDNNDPEMNKLKTIKNNNQLKTPLKNYIKIDLDVKELLKYAPNINPSNTQDIMAIASELTGAIKISPDGNILVNSSKLNPNCLSIKEKNLNLNNMSNEKNPNDYNDNDEENMNNINQIDELDEENHEDTPDIDVDHQDIHENTNNKTNNKHIRDSKLTKEAKESETQEEEIGQTRRNLTKSNVLKRSRLKKNIGILDINENDKKHVLFKSTKVFREEKYLMVINHIERLAKDTNSILNALTSMKNLDKVYEEYEIYIEVSAICLSHRNMKPLKWELSLLEARNLTDLIYPSEIAKYFIQNALIYGEKFLLTTKKKNLRYVNDECIIIQDSVIRLIQNKFRNKKFKTNYKHFEDFIKPLNKTKRILHRDIVTINKMILQVISYENDNKKLEINAWDLENYNRYILHISKDALPKLYNKYKADIIKIIYKNLIFEYLNAQQINLSLKQKQLNEAWNKFESSKG